MSESRYYQNKKVLIIDDLAEMRSSLKGKLDLLGAKKVDQASNGENALELLRNHNYGIVCCDYELGRGRDGQQVLEEARHANLLKESATFVMITAAQTLEMVMGALEYQPDGYIAKPITYDEFQKRLTKVLRRKAIFEEINGAIDDGMVDDALEHCNQLISEKPKFSLPTYRIKGKLLYNDERYKEAYNLYKTVIDINPVAWAKMGLAKCLHVSGKHDQAKTILEELIKTNKKYVECYDLLANIHCEERNFDTAQKILERAIEQSPKAVLRQSQLSSVATRNEDWNVALKSSRKAVSLGKNSVHRSPDSYLNLARALQPQLLNGGYREKTYALNEIDRALETVRQDYSHDQQVHVKASLIEGLTLQNQGKEEEAKKKLDIARATFDSLKIASAKKCVKDVGKTYVDTGEHILAEEFLTEMKEKNIYSQDSEELLSQVSEANHASKEKQEEERIIQEQRKEIDNLNNKGVELFEQGDMQGATKLFKKASKSPQASISTYLNTIQALIVFMQKEGLNEKDSKFCEALFKKLTDVTEKSSGYKKLAKLKKMYQELKA